MDWPYILVILGIAVILFLIGSLRVLRQYERGVVFLLGKFEGVRGPGLTLIFVPIQPIGPTLRIQQHQGRDRDDASCMGRSRGGLTSKIHALVDTNGRPIRLALTTGEAHDNRPAEALVLP